MTNLQPRNHDVISRGLELTAMTFYFISNLIYCIVLHGQIKKYILYLDCINCPQASFKVSLNSPSQSKLLTTLKLASFFLMTTNEIQKKSTTK